LTSAEWLGDEVVAPRRMASTVASSSPLALIVTMIGRRLCICRETRSDTSWACGRRRAHEIRRIQLRGSQSGAVRWRRLGHFVLQLQRGARRLCITNSTRHLATSRSATTWKKELTTQHEFARTRKSLLTFGVPKASTYKENAVAARRIGADSSEPAGDFWSAAGDLR
jgi:hypothetical protein